MQQRQPNEIDSGRSMVEMLGALAIMTLLSIVSIAGIRLGLNKAKANQIIKDARLAHTSLLTDPMGEPGPWLDAGFITTSGKRIQKMISENEDGERNILIKVPDVEPHICKELLNFINTGEVVFYNGTGDQRISTCGEENQDMIIMLDSSGAPGDLPEQECTSAQDCDNGWCNDGECVACPEYQQPNEEGTGCTANCNQETQWRCGIGEGENEINWCCDMTLNCGSEPGTCSDGKCSWEFNQAAPHTNCAWTFSQTTPRANCSITLNYNQDSTEVTSITTTGCAELGEYCNIVYTDTDCDATNHPLQNTSSGTLYGVCNPMDKISETCLSEASYQEITACGENQYCYLIYPSADCSGSLTNGETTLYGVCNAMTTANSVCLSEITVAQRAYCQSGEYCYLNWATNTACTTLQKGDSGNLYGTCIAINSDSISCPYNQ